MLFFSRFTATSDTPSTARAAFSTRAEHAAHVMPVTSNVCFKASASCSARPSQAAPSAFVFRRTALCAPALRRRPRRGAVSARTSS